jgi:hypothetical protein
MINVATVFLSPADPAAPEVPPDPAPVAPKPWTPCTNPGCNNGRIRFYPKPGDACQMVQDVVCTTCRGWGGWGRLP